MALDAQDWSILETAVAAADEPNGPFWRELRERALCGPVSLQPSTLRNLVALRLSRMPMDFDQGSQLFFITGMYKSGTTWMSLIAHYHPELDCPLRELHPFSAMLPKWGADQEVLAHKEWIDEVGRYGVRNAILAMFGGVFERSEKAWARRFGAKGPMADIEALIAAYPYIRVPVIVRDGRDIAVSQAFFERSYFSTGRAFDGEEQRMNDTYVAEVATNYAKYYASIHRLAESYPESIAIFSYEDLTTRPINTAASLFRFLDVSVHPSVIQHCMNAADFKKMSGRHKGEEDKGSFFRKGIVGDWHNVFTAEQGRMFSDIAGEVLRKFGYSVQ